MWYNTLMAFYEGEKSTNNTKIVNRLWEIPNKRDQSEGGDFMRLIRERLDWNTNQQRNIVNIDIEGKQLFIVHSLPVWYSFASDRFKLIDVLTIAETQEDAEYRFTEELNERSKIKEECSKIAERLLPEILSFNEVQVVMGRGDIFDDRRIPQIEHTDIDIMLFVDINTQDANQVSMFESKLKQLADRHPELNFSVGIFSPTLSGGEHDLTEERDVPVRISFDLLPLKLLIAAGPSLFKLLKPYSVDSLRYGRILADRTNGTFEELRQAALLAHTANVVA